MPKWFTVNLSPFLPLHLGEGNNQNLLGLFNTDYELMLIPGDHKKHFSLLVKVWTSGGQVINGVLAEFCLTVDPGYP